MIFNGWIILDKPSGITSAHAVAKVKRLLKPAKIGHAGTLDPLASGILPLALGEATKTVSYMMDCAKAYSFTVSWGQERDTDDSQGQVVRTSEARPSMEEINSILPRFIGKIQQIPPHYSAIKVDGARAYDLARMGADVVLKGREVRVDSLAICHPERSRGIWEAGLDPSANARDDNHGLDESKFLCHCGKGTYIRALARDMGRVLGCFGYISQLRRLKVGGFDESHAISLEVVEKMMHKGDLSFLRSVESALDDILAWNVSSDQAIQLRQGKVILLPASLAEHSGRTILARYEDKPLALCCVLQGSVKPIRGFNL